MFFVEWIILSMISGILIHMFDFYERRVILVSEINDSDTKK